MRLKALFKNYPVFLVLGLLFMASCQSFHLKSSGPPSTYGNDYEQEKLAREFHNQERKAERLARKGKNDSKTARIKFKRKSKKGEDPQIEKVITVARSYRGTPYKFGGTTRIGIDCSGLLCQSFSAIDVQLPRNSTAQSQFGPTVSEKDLQKGDLVFFGPSRGSNQITHVGLVTEVDKPKEQVTFIHSSTRLGVIEDNLYSGYWNNLFIKAVRPKL
jgi:cell wall-associated NlpC family hydrolase